ncbi:MAG TPA: RagB/SusD family nutrient uptake outer membrane protein, partial [Mucilaginibacter sp.]
MRKKILAIYGLFILFSAISCKKWVEDTPQPTQVDQSAIFSTKQGFREALNGVYLQMGTQSLYGRDLNMGVLSILGRSYDVNITPAIDPLFYQTALYNLQDPGVKSYSADVWNKMYQAIANVNNVLANLEAKKSMFTGSDYNAFKGEALALRAYLHFDLLRLFAPAPSAGSTSVSAIPYVTTITPTTTPTGSIDQVLTQCIADLQTADGLLTNVSLVTSQLNTWAVKGLLARVFIYKGDIANAQLYTNAIISSNAFALSKSNTDLFFTNESLFKLYIYNTNYYAYYKSVLTVPLGLGLSTVNQTALYVTGGGSASDWRKLAAFMAPFTGAALVMPKKFNATAANTFPMVRLTEMYYIAAECAVTNGDST